MRVGGISYFAPPFGEFYSTNGTIAVTLKPLGYAVSMKKMLAF